MKPEMTKDELDTALISWQTINKALKDFTEVDVKNALNRELMGDRRKDVAIRLHQKFSILRSARERIELVESLKDTPVFLNTTFKV